MAAAALVASAALSAQADTIVDTGTPNGQAIGAYTLDGNDAYAGQVSFAQGVSVVSIQTHLLGVDAGETFTLTLQADSAVHLPGAVLFSATATTSGEGWNGLGSLSGWNLDAGTYWVAVSVAAGDSLGSSSVTGALLDRGAPSPLQRTAFDAGGGFQATAAPLSIGLRIDAAAPVPEPATWLLWLGGAALLCARRMQRP